MPNPVDLAARLRALADEVAALGGGPAPDPQPQRPAKPTGLTVTINAEGQPALDWDDVASVHEWDVRDELNLAKPVQVTVTQPHSVRSALKPGQRRRYTIVARNAAGDSEPSDAVDVPAVSEPVPDPEPVPLPGPSAVVPGTVIDLSRWYLTLPIADTRTPPQDTSGPWDIYQPELATFVSDLFFAGQDGHGPFVEYAAPAKGTTTSGSGATRCELREMAGPSRENKAAWSFDDGKPHTLTATLTCDGTSVEGRKEVICGQIHGPGGTPPLILCVNHTRGGALEVFRQGPRQGDLLTGLTPQTRFTYRIDASGGRLRLFAAVGDVDALPAEPQFDWLASVLKEQSGLYFKAGAYNKQEVSSATTGESVVRHYRLDLI